MTGDTSMYSNPCFVANLAYSGQKFNSELWPLADFLSRRLEEDQVAGKAEPHG